MAAFRKSARLAPILPSATIAMTQLGRDLKARGRDVISLSIGEPDFATPEHVKEAAADAMARGETTYSPVPGVPALREAVADKFRRENGLDYAPDQVIVSAGGKQVIAFALLATLDPGDEVIIPTPYWVSYPQLTALAGAVPVTVATSPAAGFKMTPQQLDDAIGPKTRWLVLNSPSNPTGAVYSRTELGAIAEVLRRHQDVWILSDDIYEHLIYGADGFSTLAQVAPDLADRTLTVNGVSKAYAMTGWRIGYAGGPPPLIRAMSLMQSQLTGGAARICQWAAVAALAGPQGGLAERRAAFDARRRFVVGALTRIPGLDCPTPEGAFYAYPSCAAFVGQVSPGGRPIVDDESFCMALLEEVGVATVPGAAFGHGPAFRVSYAASDPQLREACRRIAGFCAAIPAPGAGASGSAVHSTQTIEDTYNAAMP